jgi:hypothetical protein
MAAASGNANRIAKERSRRRIGWQAKAPAPQEHSALRIKVGQALPPVNPANSAIRFFILYPHHVSPGAKLAFR